MLLKLPPSLKYPITITKIHKHVGHDVARNDTLFDYTFKVKVTWGSRDGEDQVREEIHGSKFESSLEGKVKRWDVWEKDTINGPRAIVEVEEPCSHDVQFSGMCAMCGKDMTLFTGYNTDIGDTERAPIRMTHDTQALTVSEAEAARVEEVAKRRLLSSRKLSLVVDLDQTIIHAAVDPTIAEWQKDVNNPNYEAVKDVRAFQLVDDGPGMRGCWYYIKLRPGLMKFLEHIAKLYELHIYTMGTRQYAIQIAKIVDPQKKFFGDRILSRDESGSMQAKSLARLFPVDTKMVVIIDDRGDVWKWSDNLIKVAPFDFFVGIGDINSSFLPKQQEIPSTPEAKEQAPAEKNGNTAPESSEKGVSALEQLVTMGGGNDPAVRELQSTKQEEAITSQVADKPLLQMQKKLDEEDEALAASEEAASSSTSSSTSEEEDKDTTPVNGANGHPTESPSTVESTPLAPTQSHQRHSLLRNDDAELEYLEKALSKVHAAFFTEFDRRRLSNKGGRVATLAGKGKMPLDSDNPSHDVKFVPDVGTVMPAMKHKALSGVVIVFSGVLPLGSDIQSADISVWARSFGAVIEEDIKKRTTHVVAARTGTAKVKSALKKKHVQVVSPKWLFQCFSQWRKVDEGPFLLEPQDPSTQDAKRKTSEDDYMKPFLSSSEEESENELRNGDAETDSETKSQNARAKRLKLNTDQRADDDDIITDSNTDDAERSPVSPLTIDVDEIHQELDDFLGSDNEIDWNAESDRDNNNDTDNSDAESTLSIRSSRGQNVRKRKLDAMSNLPDNPEDNPLDSSRGPDDASDPMFEPKVKNKTGLRNAIRPAAASADEFNTVPAAVLNGRVPDNDETMNEQEDIEQAEFDEAAEEEDSDDELARELERELEDDEDSNTETDEVAGGGNAEEAGFMGAAGGGGGGVNDIEEDQANESRQIDGWSLDLDNKK